MAIPWKCVVQYIQYTFSWEEVYYVEKDTIDAAGAVFDGGFVAASLACRHPSTYISVIRVSAVDQPRNAKLFPVLGAGPGGGVLVPEPTRLCAQYRIGNASIPAMRPLFLRGILDSDVARNPVTGQDTETGHLLAARNIFFGAMEARSISVQQLLPITHVDPYDFYPAVSVTVGAGGKTTIVWDSVPTLPSTNRVILSGFDPKLWPGLNGHYRARKITPPQFDVNYVARRPAATYLDGLGKFRVEAYRYFTIRAADCKFTRYSSRDTNGGPTGGRGRQRSVRLRYR